MKLTPILFAAALMASPAAADTTTVGEYCDRLSSLAENVMGSRQDGVPMREVMDAMKSIPGGPDMVILAYEYPSFPREPHYTRSIVEFGNQMHIRCLQTGGEMA